MVLIILCNGWGRCVWVHVSGYGSLGVEECFVGWCNKVAMYGVDML